MNINSYHMGMSHGNYHQQPREAKSGERLLLGKLCSRTVSNHRKAMGQGMAKCCSRPKQRRWQQPLATFLVRPSLFRLLRQRKYSFPHTNVCKSYVLGTGTGHVHIGGDSSPNLVQLPARSAPPLTHTHSLSAPFPSCTSPPFTLSLPT